MVWALAGRERLRTQRVVDRIRSAVLPVLANLGYELVEIGVAASHGRRTLRIFIHRPGGVTLDGCAAVSKALGPVIDDEGLFPGRYYLEVSSPGAERKLRSRDDFRIFVGSKARLRTRGADGAHKEVEGRIEGFSGDVVTMRQEDGSALAIPLDEIAGANLCL
jgi:ribosome maturation factor RimP